MSTQEVIDEICKGYVPANTKRNTEWSRRVFAEWRASRDDEEVCPPDLLENPNIKKLNFWIPRFINEVRCIDGKPYPPRTINQILAGLQRHLLDNDYCFPKFLDRKNSQFRPIHGACECVIFNGEEYVFGRGNRW